MGDLVGYLGRGVLWDAKVREKAEQRSLKLEVRMTLLSRH